MGATTPTGPFTSAVLYRPGLASPSPVFKKLQGPHPLLYRAAGSGLVSRNPNHSVLR
jgi:hypothetical protein